MKQKISQDTDHMPFGRYRSNPNMKILKPGKKKPRSFIGTCEYCGCEVLAKESEVRNLSDREGELYAVTCPQCKNRFLYVK
jgi:hypothetical protein